MKKAPSRAIGRRRVLEAAALLGCGVDARARGQRADLAEGDAGGEDQGGGHEQ